MLVGPSMCWNQPYESGDHNGITNASQVFLKGTTFYYPSFLFLFLQTEVRSHMSPSTPSFWRLQFDAFRCMRTHLPKSHYELPLSRRCHSDKLVPYLSVMPLFLQILILQNAAEAALICASRMKLVFSSYADKRRDRLRLK